jgi:hypothetical protein
MPSGPIDFTTILIDLVTAKVDFIVVGGIAASLQGAPIHTIDLDIVHARGDQNVRRLAAILEKHKSYYREHPDRRPPPDVKLLGGPGHHLLDTDAGPVDLLGVIGQDESYFELLPATIELAIESDVKVRVLTLEKIIALKRNLGREKDRAMLKTLEDTQGELSRDESSN